MSKYGRRRFRQTHVGKIPEGYFKGGIRLGHNRAGSGIFIISLINYTWFSQHCTLGNRRLAEDSPKPLRAFSSPVPWTPPLCASPTGSSFQKRVSDQTHLLRSAKTSCWACSGNWGEATDRKRRKYHVLQFIASPPSLFWSCLISFTRAL